MESLPSEICSKILSHIPFYDLLELRLVNKWFDEQVTRQFSLISWIRFTSERNPLVYLEPIDCLFKFNVLEVHIENQSDLVNILSVLKGKFPTIQGIELDGYGTEIKLSLLIPFAESLKFIKVHSVKVDFPFKSVEEIMDMFPALQAFDVEMGGEIFCPRMWARRDNVIRWTDVCSHQPPCKKAGDLPPHQWIELTDFSPRQYNLNRIAPSLEVLVLEGLEAVPPILHLPVLKYFSLRAPNMVLENRVFLNFLGNAPRVRSISVHTRSSVFANVLSFLSFINSLPQVETIKFSVKKVVDQSESVQPLLFAACEKKRLTFVHLHLAELSRVHLPLFERLLNSSEPLSGLYLHSYKGLRVKVIMNSRGKESSLDISTEGSDEMKQLLEALPPRYHLLTTKLKLFTKHGLEACFAQHVLKFKNLQKLSGRLKEEFVLSWLPLFTQSDNRKNIQLEFQQYGLPAFTRQTKYRLIEGKINGSIANFTTDSGWCQPDDHFTIGLHELRIAT